MEIVVQDKGNCLDFYMDGVFCLRLKLEHPTEPVSTYKVTQTTNRLHDIVAHGLFLEMMRRREIEQALRRLEGDVCQECGGGWLHKEGCSHEGDFWS